MKVILAENMNAAKEFCAKYTTNVSEEAIVVQSIRTLQGLRFRYEDVVRVPGWSKRDDIEEIEDWILRAHIMMPPRPDVVVDANLPTYTRDFLAMINEGKLEYDICTYGTMAH